MSLNFLLTKGHLRLHQTSDCILLTRFIVIVTGMFNQLLCGCFIFQRYGIETSYGKYINIFIYLYLIYIIDFDQLLKVSGLLQLFNVLKSCCCFHDMVAHDCPLTIIRLLWLSSFFARCCPLLTHIIKTFSNFPRMRSYGTK